MKKKITIVDKDLNQLVVVADCSSALYQDRGTKLGEQNLLSDTTVTFKVYDGTAQVAVMMADILQVPTKRISGLLLLTRSPTSSLPSIISVLEMPNVRCCATRTRKTALQWFCPSQHIFISTPSRSRTPINGAGLLPGCWILL